jgi:AcrR family transcriptional regulator
MPLPPPTATSEQLSVRQRLLNAAEQVVVREGVANLTLDAVAREAGVSKGGLLYHFPTKSALITAIVERLAQRCEASQTRAMELEPDSPGAFTRAYLRARAGGFDPEEAPLHTALLMAAATNPQYLGPFRARAVEWLHRIESDGIDPVTAHVVRLAIHGLCLGMLFGMPVAEGQMRQNVIDRLLEMTRAKNADAKEKQPS